MKQEYEDEFKKIINILNAYKIKPNKENIYFIPTQDKQDKPLKIVLKDNPCPLDLYNIRCEYSKIKKDTEECAITYVCNDINKCKYFYIRKDDLK